jgi:hypothetical protein
LEVIADGILQVEVRQSYFKGSHYLVKAVVDQKVIFFDSSNALVAGTKVCLGLRI